MRCLIAIAAIMLAGCAMSNDEVIAETKKCLDAGMRVTTTYGITGRIIYIGCAPPKDKEN